MRGRVPGIRKDLERMGITPAYAGKSRKNGTCNRQIWDHPRVCGEELSAIGGMYYELGSPPRMRGRVIRGLATRITSGITPAYAGKSLRRAPQRPLYRDHPRVCGEETKKFHSIGHFSCILCLFHSVLHRASASGGSRAGPCAPPCLPAQNAIPV